MILNLKFKVKPVNILIGSVDIEDLKLSLQSKINDLNHLYSNTIKTHKLENFNCLMNNWHHKYDYISGHVIVETYVDFDHNGFHLDYAEMNNLVLSYDPSPFYKLRLVDGNYLNPVSLFKINSWIDTAANIWDDSSKNTCNHDWRHDRVDEDGTYDWCAKCGEKTYKQKTEKYI